MMIGANQLALWRTVFCGCRGMQSELIQAQMDVLAAYEIAYPKGQHGMRVVTGSGVIRADAKDHAPYGSGSSEVPALRRAAS